MLLATAGLSLRLAGLVVAALTTTTAWSANESRVGGAGCGHNIERATDE